MQCLQAGADQQANLARGERERATKRATMEGFFDQGNVVIDETRAALCLPMGGVGADMTVLKVERVTGETNITLLRRLADLVTKELMR